MIEGEIKFLPDQKIIKQGEIEILLTDIEWRIFEMLFKTNQNFASRGELYPDKKSRILNVHINKLRKKISPLKLEIDTVRNKGYRLKQIS